MKHKAQQPYVRGALWGGLYRSHLEAVLDLANILRSNGYRQQNSHILLEADSIGCYGYLTCIWAMFAK